MLIYFKKYVIFPQKPLVFHFPSTKKRVNKLAHSLCCQWLIFILLNFLVFMRHERFTTIFSLPLTDFSNLKNEKFPYGIRNLFYVLLPEKEQQSWHLRSKILECTQFHVQEKRDALIQMSRFCSTVIIELETKTKRDSRLKEFRFSPCLLTYKETSETKRFSVKTPNPFQGYLM